MSRTNLTSLFVGMNYNTSPETEADIEAVLIRNTPITTVQRDAINAVSGMEIYNSDTNSKQLYDGTVWVNATSHGSIIKSDDSDVLTNITNGVNYFAVNANTEAVNLNNFTSPSNMTLKYIGSEPTIFRIRTEFVGSRGSGGGATNYRFIYKKNGVDIDVVKNLLVAITDTPFDYTALTREMLLVQNDEIVMAVNQTGSVNLQTNSVFMYIEKV